MKSMIKYTGLVLAASAFLASAPASAQVKLQAASCFPQGSFFSKRFEALIESVNEKGVDKVEINYVGGAPAIGSQLTVVQKVAQGVYDLNSCTGSYYLNTVPEADAWKLMENTPTQVRENGGWDFMNEIHNAKNLQVLSRHHFGSKFYLFLADGHKIDKPDLSGLHLRVAPIYTNFFKSLGATTQDTNIQQIFTLMENGTVQGYGWPVLGHRPGWEKVTKYRVEPGFYDVDLTILANKRVWDGLPDDVRALIENAALELEAEAMAKDSALDVTVAAKQLENGFEAIQFSAEDEAEWIAVARDAGCAGVLETSPDNGPKLRQFFAKE